jgi:hypothetical protein
MNRWHRLSIIALLACFIHLPLLAAEAELETEAEETSEVQQPEGDNVASDDSATGGDTEEMPEEESPSRFIPTEQISQDLGVSFPADI